MKRVVLRPNAFMNILLSVTEPYKHECLGPVFGRIIKNRVIVENALPFQTVKRTYNSIWHTPKAENLKTFLSHFRNVIGDFHSHSDFKSGMNAELSEDDERTLPKGRISLIVGVKKYKKKINSIVDNRVEDGKGFSFALNGYKYLLRCYYKDKWNSINELRINKVRKKL